MREEMLDPIYSLLRDLADRQESMETALKDHMKNEERAFQVMTEKMEVVEQMQLAMPQMQDGRIDILKHSNHHQKIDADIKDAHDLAMEAKKKLVSVSTEWVLRIGTAGMMVYMTIHHGGVA